MPRFRIHIRLVLASVIALLLAAPAFAYRREYVVTFDGVRKPGSEVCFYRGASASDAFSLYFSYDRAACLPADAVVDLPPGLFHVFARHADGYVSGFDDFFVYQGEPAPEEGYGRLEIPLRPAARADVSDLLLRLDRGQRIGVWLAPTETETGTYLPLIEGETDILVPAGRPFLPLMIAKGVPVAVGDPLTLRAGARTKIPSFESANRADFVGWVKVHAAEGTIPERLVPAEVALVTADGKVEPLFPLHGAGATHTLMFFKPSAVGPAHLAVRGRTWVHSDVEVDVGRGVTVLRPPIVLVPGAALSVNWNVSADQTPPERCREAGHAEESEIRATLLSCAGSGVGTPSCTPVARRSTSFSSGAIDFDGVPAGTYTVEVQPPAAKAVEVQVSLDAGEIEEVTVPLTAFRFFGAVTVNGKPVQALLRFASGDARSDSTGRYDAALAADPLGNLIRVVLCADGRTSTWIPDGRIAENSAYDISIMEEELAVTVLDASSGAPVKGASVTFSPSASTDPAEQTIHYTSAAEITNEAGRAVFANVPAGRALVVCAAHDAYAPACGPRLSPSDVRKGKATVSLAGAVRRGRVIGHDGVAIVAFVDETGQVIEEAPIGAEGTFSFQRVHTGREHVVYASSSRPLAVLPIPTDALHPEELVLTLPAGPVRSFTVTVQGMRTSHGYVGLWVGGRYVPLDLLAFHGDHRGVDVLVRRDRAFPISDIFETGPITVAFIPDLPAAPGPFSDPFTRPEYRGLRRYPVSVAAVNIPAE
ncbi:MAG TPA: carboxypeptidase-like regulatory domain-containing protein [Thermoanaerobaculia bacterium]|nr:carboxypeptidase-like regulatory domain-containing protein [Thermoanaerobaculia bacterium]